MKLPLAKGSDERNWQGVMLLWSRGVKMPAGIGGPIVEAPTRYQVELLDVDGFRAVDPLWHSIALAKDQPPTVTVLLPGRDLQVDPKDTVKLRVLRRTITVWGKCASPIA